jgi:kynurenine 3-monooxygenase
MPTNPRFTIIGAGLGGTLLACYLGKTGYSVDLYEKRPDPRIHGAEGGRSINLALSVRGIEALREIGLAEEVLRNAIPMRGRMIHAPDGQLSFQPYGKDPSQAIHSVSRAGLNLTLVNAAARFPNVRLFFGHKCTGIDLAGPALEMANERNHGSFQVPCDIAIAADGAFSAIRAHVQKQEGFNYQQAFESHGYKELTIPAGPDGSHHLEKHALHIWPRQSFMMIALPNLDGSFTVTLFWPFEGPNSFAATKTDDDLVRLFKAQFSDALPLMPNLQEDYFRHPTGSLVTIRCSPWHVVGKVLLLGDAAHAVVPFLGQGMNAAFEDCRVLNQCLAHSAPDWECAFVQYQHQRKVHVDALADMCIDNFLEMRDRVGSRLFRFRKRIQILLHKLFPHWYIPLYTLITFTTVPYATARKRVHVQDWVIRGIGGGILLLLMVLVWSLLR